MNKLFSQTTIIGLILFLALSIYNIYKDVRHDINYIENINSIQNQINSVDVNSKIVLELQEERGLTSIYLSNTSQQHLNKLISQREETFKALSNVHPDLKKSIEDIRLKVTAHQNNRLEVFYTYSEIIRDLLLDTESLTFNSDNKVLKNELHIYNDLNVLQEILGQIRAKVGVVLSAGELSEEDKKELQRRNILFEHHLEETFINDIISSRKYTKQISKTKCLKRTLRISKGLEHEFHISDKTLSALEWFELSTCAITKINSFVNAQRKIIHEYILLDMQNAEDERIHNAIFWLLGAIILFIFILISIKRSKELLKEQALLRSYKLAIDYSSIVSTTDKDGVITYVNENFSTLSGYSNKELIGNNHNIIRHPDMPAKIFKNMWATIVQGKKWNGLVKNKKKDGGFYWADSFIIPIFDDHNELVEYISIRHDVSEMIQLHQEIEETQTELLYRLGEAVESRSKESGYHIQRVAHYSKLLAQLSNLSDEQCKLIFTASSMHDVGKIAIPDSILLKPGKLDAEEWTIMKMHAEIGYKLFENSHRPILKAAADIAHEHHEHYNGKGYPRGLKENDISIFGRIVAIADVFDALYTDRVYKDAWPLDKILTLMKEESGKQFDPHLITLFIDNIDLFVEIKDIYKEDTSN